MNKTLLIFLSLLFYSFTVMADDLSDAKDAFARDDYATSLSFFNKAADSRTDCPAHAAVRHGIVVDGEFLRAPPVAWPGRLAPSVGPIPWPASLRVAQSTQGPFLTPLLRRNMTIAIQSGRICGKARLTRRSTGKSRIT